MTEDAFLKNHPLPTMLPFLVEMAILDVREWTPEQRIGYARARAQTFAEKSDTLMFASKTKGEAGQLAGELAKVIACLSFQPGGVKLFGCYWQSEPDPPEADPGPGGMGLGPSPVAALALSDLFTFTDDSADLPPGDTQP